MSGCGFVLRSVVSPKVRGIRSAIAGVIGDCEQSNMGTRNLGSTERATSTPNHRIISPSYKKILRQGFII